MTTPTATPQPVPTLSCECGHLPVEHDRVALRYCQATLAAGLERGCICPPAQALPDGAPGR
jgi:hypothetical protein